MLSRYNVHILKLLNGARTTHRRGVFHRDLKPSNILMDSKVKVQICDLGLARAEASNPPDFHWTDYVATRWYRAPKLVFALFTMYSTATDMWSIGAIFAEMLNQGTPLRAAVYTRPTDIKRDSEQQSSNV